MADEPSAEQPIEQPTAQQPSPEPPTAAAHDDAARLLTLAQAADYLDVSRRRLNTLRRQGKIPAQRVGWRGWRFRAADLMAHVEGAVGTSPSTEAGAAADDASPKPAASPLEEVTRIVMEMGPPSDDDGLDATRVESKEAPMVRLANAILVTAIENAASDIHIEPDRKNVRVRIRVDGVMMQLMTLPKHLQSRLTDRFKVMADVPLYERASPHQGSIPLKHGEKDYNLRVSVVPSYYGESLVLHVLQQNLYPTFEELGFTPAIRYVLEQLILSSRGLLLIAGPAGAGRTTTAGKLLNHLNSVERKICTYEDVPELIIGGIEHSYRWKMKEITPADAITALLEHNADVLFLGDLTDAATAKAAVDAAQTGILVIATIAARDSVDALTRLVAFGVAPGEIVNTVTGVVAQHLLPKICPDCGGEGCDACHKKGRGGRIGVFEAREIGENECYALSGKMPLTNLREMPVGRYMGQTPLLEDARVKAEQGIVPADAVEHLERILPK